MGEPDFICAICEQPVPMHWNRPGGSDATIPPICLYCEHIFSEGVGKPAAGSMGDRRMVRRGVALAEALRTAVGHRTWGGSFGGT